MVAAHTLNARKGIQGGKIGNAERNKTAKPEGKEIKN
jgi:hypothetical protein